MPRRIPAADLARLKQEVSLERLVEQAGVALKRHGKDLVGLCPFHDDKEPSLVISPEKNLWHCLGACNAGGSVIDWVMKFKGVSFLHAYELLREGSPDLGERPLKQTTVRTLPPPVSFDADDQQLLNQVIDYYHRTLKENNDALGYLDKRGIRNEEAIHRFKLGLANRTLGLRLPDKQRKAGAEVRARLEKLGIMRASGHEHFAGCLIIPILDERGNVVHVYGRKINKVKEGEPKHLYLPGSHEGVWNLEALQANEEIIVCEALIDALTFWCAGYRNVTAAYGTSGFTDDHLKAFKQYGTKRVLIAYDRDDAGEVSAAQLAEKLLSDGIDCYRIQFPKSMDANEYALSVTPATKSLGVAIRKAVWLGNGQAPSITTEARPASASVTVATSSVAPATAEPIDSPESITVEPSSLAAEAKTSDAVVLPASPLPKPVSDETACEVREGEVNITLGDRHYRVRGLNKNLALDVVLKVNVMVTRGDAFHVDTLDLYAPRAKQSFLVQAAIELNVKEDVIRHDLGRVLRRLEALQEQNVKQTLAPKKDERASIAEPDQLEALALLKEPKLLDRILADFTACGIVGEETNKLIGYLAATSRKLDAPLAVMIQSSSAAGKSSLMDAVLALMPEEDKVQYSAMTGQALFYMSSINLKHKILALAEEAGAARAAYALKLLQSEGVLTIASTGKNPETGELVTQEYKVEGPVMIFSTTTAIDHDEELMNRCLTIGVDESREQTRAILKLQRQKRTLEGLFAKKAKERIVKQHQNAQRLLRALAVRNPYADDLTFPDERTRLRRDHEKYLTLIDTIALLHQYQRPIKTTVYDGETLEYVEVTLDDIAMATRLAHDALGRSLDELHPQTRRLLLLIDAHVREATTQLAIARVDYRFSRRDVRHQTGWSDTQLRLHLDRLVDLEYLLVHRGGRGQSFVYELLYDGAGKDGKPFVPGLIDIETLRRSTSTTKTSRGSAGEFAGSTRGDRGPNAPGSRSNKNNKNTFNQSTDRNSHDRSDENALLSEAISTASYLQDAP